MLKTVQTMTAFRNPLADPLGTRRGPPLVRGPQFENRCTNERNPSTAACFPGHVMRRHDLENLVETGRIEGRRARWRQRLKHLDI